MEPRQNVQQERGFLRVGAQAPVGSGGNLAGAVTPQHLPRASQLRLGPDAYLFLLISLWLCEVLV